jgi:hypothetical protein
VPANRNTVTIPTTGHLWREISGAQLYGPLVGRVQELAGAARAFHWPLEFPDVMAAGGFDVVLGNPPWERIKLQEQEFFAAREPKIAEAPNAAARGNLIATLKAAEAGTRERALFEEFETAKRIAESSSVFARVPGEDGGRFPLTGRGDMNTYALFAELFAFLVRHRWRTTSTNGALQVTRMRQALNPNSSPCRRVCWRRSRASSRAALPLLPRLDAPRPSPAST